MALYIPHSIFHLARLMYVRPETFGPYYVVSSTTVVRLETFGPYYVVSSTIVSSLHSGGP